MIIKTLHQSDPDLLKLKTILSIPAIIRPVSISFDLKAK